MVLKTKALPPLGALEAALLEAVWSTDELDVTEAHRAVGIKRGITPNTVGSALERLYRKRLLTRRKVSHAYRYAAALSREVYAARRVVEAAGSLDALAQTGLLAAFVDLVADVDDDALDRLEVLIAEKRGEKGHP